MSFDMTSPFDPAQSVPQETLPLTVDTGTTPTAPVTDAESSTEDATDTAREPQEATFQAATEPVPADPTPAVTEAPSELPTDAELARLVTETHAMVKDLHDAFTEVAPSLVSMTEAISKGGLMGMMGRMFG